MRPRPSRLFRNRPAPNYTAAAVSLGKRVGVPGELLEVAILHDDWCAQLAGKGPCNCNPEVKTMAEHRRDQAGRN